MFHTIFAIVGVWGSYLGMRYALETLILQKQAATSEDKKNLIRLHDHIVIAVC